MGKSTIATTTASPVVAGLRIVERWRGHKLFHPDDAAAALEINLGNRRYRPSFVRFLARSIQNGEWQDDHPQPVIFSDAGRMIDGQHRMLAILEAGLSVTVCVAAGERDALREYLDICVPRSLSDRVEFNENSATNSSIAHIVNQWPTLAGDQHTGRLTTEEAVQLFLAHDESITFSARSVTHKRGTGRVPVAVALAQMWELNHEKAEEFAASLHTVDGAVQQARVLRDFLLQCGAAMNGAAGSKLIYGKAICAMEAYLQGREIRRLRESRWQS